MLKSLIGGKRATTKADVLIAIGAAAMALYKAFDTHRQYKAEQAEIEEKAE